MIRKQPAALEAVLEKVSAVVTPTRAEADAEKEFALKITSLIEPRLPSGARVYFVGSAARDTGLRGDRDVDLFVSFPATFSRERIVELTGTILKKSVPGKWEMHYAEHPYYQSLLQGFKVEVIPCFKVEPHAPIKSAVDRSPLHMDYLQKRLNPSQKRDVRCLKQLLKTAGIYGAEASIGGFSGLLCEYLVLNYRSLETLLAEASAWTPPVAVDIESAFPDATANELSEKFGGAHLVIIDAIDHNRNAAAAVTLDSLASFISLSRAASTVPSAELFFEKPPVVKNCVKWAASRKTYFALLEFNLPSGLVEDVFAPQLRKTSHSLANALRIAGFRMIDCQAFHSSGRAAMLFESLDAKLPKLRVRAGPPAFLHSPAAEFVALHQRPSRGPFIKDGRVIVEELCHETTLQEAVADLLGSTLVSFGSNIERQIKRARITDAKKASGVSRECLANYASRKSGWL
ncbi:MAG: CCA tRNA nucleotidyltransferase [Candidatus Micrarchaeota archaeon]